MTDRPLYNTFSKEELNALLDRETFERRTLSFYRYTPIGDPTSFREEIYRLFAGMQCLGRIYVAHEGINAQMSVPEPETEHFLGELDKLPGMKDMPIKWAVEDDSRSFLKLIVKTRKKIVADGLEDDAYDVSNVGRHLTPEEFHRHSLDPETLVVDMRNDYEYEIGHFNGALNLQTDTFREAMVRALDELGEQKDRKILLYCTGGVRCEKASSWLKHHGFNDVNQLHGGIIEYARFVRAEKLPSNFTGKNFVFDNRMGESIDGKVISHCHTCGEACDTYTNCSNDHCHVLFIQCSKCAEKYEGACSPHCQSILHMSEEEKSSLSHEVLSNNPVAGFNNAAIRRRQFEVENTCTV